MVRAPFVNYLVRRRDTDFFLGFFLKKTLGVAIKFLGDNLRQFFQHETGDEFIARFVSAIKIYGSNQRFKRVGQYVLPGPACIFGLTSGGEEIFLQIKLMGSLRKYYGIHQSPPPIRKFSFGIGVIVE